MTKGISIWFALCFAGLLPHTKAIAQSERELIDDNVVEVHSGKHEVGTGFVVAQQHDTVFIVTAAHVVENPDSVKVYFNGGQFSGDADAIEVNDNFDVSVLRMVCPNRPWRPLHYATNVRGGVPAYFLSVRSGRTILNRSGAAIVSGVKVDELLADVLAEHGDSGAPLFSDDGIIGMIFKSPGHARPIKFIKGLLDEWQVPWGLEETRKDAFSPSVGKYKPIKSIQNLRTGEIMQELYDNDVQTTRTINAAGPYQYTISFSSEVEIDSVLFFCPGGNDEVLPAAARLIFPGSKQPIRLKPLKSPATENNSHGRWIIFPLPDSFVEKELQFEFLIGKLSTGSILPFTFYEIQFR